ncbi:ribonuclease H family protein [Lysinibacillus sp. KU-BSD001]|uniref:ribonuclease H family protein n=1 Tax=Lysinibacillus sp. KU-BSD001 TaxID=3141328 RepID=UPI0036E5B0A5
MKLTIEWTYKTPKGATTIFRSEPMSVEHTLMIAEDLERTGRVKTIEIMDEHDSTWMIKELKKYIKEMETEPHNIKVYFDGGFDVQTKGSGLGVAIYYEKDGKSYRLRRNAYVSSLDSNNEAEYAALHLSLVELELMDVHHQTVRFIGDSQVVINQLNGEWPAYEQNLASWADKIEGKLHSLGIIPEYELISRKQNTEADRLATQALQGTDISGEIELQS